MNHFLEKGNIRENKKLHDEIQKFLKRFHNVNLKVIFEFLLLIAFNPPESHTFFSTLKTEKRI